MSRPHIGETETARPWSNTNVVYFIRNPDSGLIKIGTTAYLSRRLSCLRSHSGAELELLGSLPGNRYVEAGLHSRWAGLRVRGEWFRPDPEILEWIKCLP